MNSQESLWFVPDSVLERLNFKGRDSQWAEFMLCGLYCAVAVSFLVFFGFAALLREEDAYAMVILGFAMITCVVYGAIWVSGELYLARHFVVVLMAALCLFLYYSGGTENTGPMYFFVFPVVAVFLQGVRIGSIGVITLPLISLLMQETGFFGFDTTRYSFVFISRIYTIYIIISILALLFAWFREKVELELLLSEEDLERIIHVDPLTGLCNRNFMLRLLKLEHKRFKRYNNPFCLMLIRIDNHERIHQRYGAAHINDLLTRIAELLMRALRNVDIPARWDRDLLMAMMPHSNLTEARLMAERMREEIHRQTFISGTVTVSIGISEITDELEEAIAIAEENLHAASQDNGNSVVSSKASGLHYAPSNELSDIFREH